MKTNFLRIVLAAALTATVSAAPRPILGSGSSDRESAFFVEESFGLEADLHLFAPGGPQLGERRSLEALPRAAVMLTVNSSAAMDFVEVELHTAQSLLEEPVEGSLDLRVTKRLAEEAVPAPGGWTFLSVGDASPELSPVPEPAVYFLGAFAAVLLLLARRRSSF